LDEVSSKLTRSSAEKAFGDILGGDVELIRQQKRNYEPPLEELRGFDDRFFYFILAYLRRKQTGGL
jgi:hypothetical protein